MTMQFSIEDKLKCSYIFKRWDLMFFFRNVVVEIFREINQTQRYFGYLCAKNCQNIFIVAKVRWQNQTLFGESFFYNLYLMPVKGESNYV